jgi:hypothetical protein
MSQGQTEQAVGTAGTSAARTLFAMLGGAIAWALHFLGSYAVVAIGCVAGWSATRLVVAAGTAALATLALLSTAVAGREWRGSSGDQRWDTALSEPRGWYSWLMTVGVLMGITSAFTIVLEGFGTLMLPLCGWNVR